MNLTIYNIFTWHKQFSPISCYTEAGSLSPVQWTCGSTRCGPLHVLWWVPGEWFFLFSPPVRWGLLDFMYAVLLLPFFLPLLLPRRSSPSSSPDVARCQHGPPDCIKHRRTSTGGLWSGLGNAGPQPGGSGADWATPDLTRGPPERNGQRRTSVARRYVRRCVRNMSEKNVRKNVRRYVRRNVRKYVKRYVRRNVRRYVRKECQ